MFNFIKAALALAVLAALIVSALPMSWRQDCDICGEYVDDCRKFTIRKGDPSVTLHWDCGGPYQQDAGFIRYRLADDGEGFRLAPAGEMVVNRTVNGRPIIREYPAPVPVQFIRAAKKVDRSSPLNAIDVWQVTEIAPYGEYFGRSKQYVRVLARDRSVH